MIQFLLKEEVLLNDNFDMDKLYVKKNKKYKKKYIDKMFSFLVEYL